MINLPQVQKRNNTFGIEKKFEKRFTVTVPKSRHYKERNVQSKKRKAIRR